MANWGIDTIVASTTTPNWARAMGGTSPNLDNMVLDSVSIYVGTTHTQQIRLAVYSGGDLVTGPAGATLLHDYGETSGSGTSEWLTITGPQISLPKNTPTWVAFRNNGGYTVYYQSSSPIGSDYQTARGRWASIDIDGDETSSYPSTWPTDSGGSFSNFWYSVYLTYSIASDENTKIAYTESGPSVFNVPAGVNFITVKGWGAGAGGAAGGSSGVGGSGGGGGYVQGTIAVTPLEQLTVHVGGKGELGAFTGANSGSGGGGAGRCAVFRGSTPLFIAGGGGGGGGGDNSNPDAGGAGGAGGDNTGGSGGNSSSSIGAGGGTQTTGGAGGTGGANVGVAGEDYDGSPAGGGGDGADGTTGTSKGGQGNGGITNGGSGGTGDVVAGYAGGGGGGSGRSGGGGGASSVASDAGGSGGGGGSNYIDGSATSTTNSQASGVNPPNTGDEDYQVSAGVGGAGGGTSTDGSDGNDGRIVILFPGATFYYGMQFMASNSEYLSSVTTFTPPLSGSVSAWMYLYDNPGSAVQRVMGTEGIWELRLGTDAPGTLSNDLNQGAVDLDSNTIFQANKPYHVVCTYGNDATNFGRCLNYDGESTTAVTVAGYYGITGTAARSMEALIKSTDTGDNNIISYGEVVDTEKWRFYIDVGTGKLRCEVQGGYIIGNTVINDGEWHRIGITCTASSDIEDAILYVDGVDDGVSDSAAQSINTSSATLFRIGAGIFTGASFDGLIDDVRIWSDVRTPTEMADNAWKQLNGDEAGLEGYWQMNETSGTAVPDLSPNNRNGDSTNMVDSDWVASLGAGDGRIFIDGVLDSTGTNQTGSPGSDNLRIGHTTDATGEYFNGLLEDVRIYDRPLTEAECAIIYGCRGTDGITYGLLHRWRLNDGPLDTTASDSSGFIKDLAIGANNMTPVNTPVFKGTILKMRRFI